MIKGGIMIDRLMVEDHQYTNILLDRLITELKRSEFSASTLSEVSKLLLRHIYIEEAILFPEVDGKVKDEDIEELEKEHAVICRSLEVLQKEKSGDKALKTASEMLALLFEHNAFEESFIYDFFVDFENSLIEGVNVPKGWKCKFCG